MRKEELHNALMHPENLSDTQLMELRDTVARFPFFGAAQIALTRAFKARGDIRFTDQLSQAAIYTGHRASLYNRLKSIKPAVSELIQDEKAQLPLSEEPTLASLILDNELSSEKETHEIVSNLPSASVEVGIQWEETKSTADKIEQDNSEVSSLNHEKSANIKLNELDVLEAQILVSAVNTSIELEVQPSSAENSTESMPIVQDEEPMDENSYAALIYRRAQRKNLLSLEQLTGEVAPESETDDKDDLPAFRSTPLSHGVQRIRSTDAKQHQRDLIDRFIHTEPQIARGKAVDYPAGNLAKDSLEDDFSMVTETMAVLFAKQGKLDKARKAFRKLMEQHPEKSIYFAAQLKNLEHFKK